MTLTADLPTATEPDPRDPILRLSKLFDAGSLEPLHPRDSSGVVTARGIAAAGGGGGRSTVGSGSGAATDAATGAHSPPQRAQRSPLRAWTRGKPFTCVALPLWMRAPPIEIASPRTWRIASTHSPRAALISSLG